MTDRNGKCKFCGEVLLDKANIRCDVCNEAWQDGFDEGEKRLREKIQETARHFMKFLGVIKP